MNKRGRIRLYLLLVTAILLFMLIVQAQILTPSGENTSELLSVRSNLSSGSGGGGVRFLGQIAENLSEIIVSEEQNKQEQIFQSINLSNTSSRSIKYDSRIVEEFNKTNISKVKVIVRLADDSAIKVAGAKEEKRELLRQRDEWFKSKNEIFLSTLPKNHFNISSNITDGFVGMITKEGLDILLNDSSVESVYQDKKVYGQIVDNTPASDAEDGVSQKDVVPDNELEVKTIIVSENEKKESKTFLWVGFLLAIVVVVFLLYLTIIRKKQNE